MQYSFAMGACTLVACTRQYHSQYKGPICYAAGHAVVYTTLLCKHACCLPHDCRSHVGACALGHDDVVLHACRCAANNAGVDTRHECVMPCLVTGAGSRNEKCELGLQHSVLHRLRLRQGQQQYGRKQTSSAIVPIDAATKEPLQHTVCQQWVGVLPT